MGWRSDWLYQLIFKEVERVWKRAQRDGRSRFGPAPTTLLISEMREADWERVLCRGDVHRQWIYRGGKPEALPLVAGGETDPGKRRGMFYERGAVAFHIASDRKRVLFTYTLGPRYGRGMIFRVRGQGVRGRLSPAEGPIWVS